MLALGREMQADLALVQRARANDRAAFNEIVLRYKQKVYRYIRRMVSRDVDAEDLTQETFVRAYTSLASFQNKASLNTWLFRIATNLCIDFSRKKSSKDVSLTADNDDDEGATWEMPDTSFEPQKLLMQSELAGLVEKAIGILPDKMRTVILLYDVENLSYEEIMAIVGCPLGTVKSRLFHARMNLREQLTPYLKA